MIIKIAIALLLTLIGFLIGVFYRGRLEPKTSGTIYFVKDDEGLGSYVEYKSEEAFKKAIHQRYLKFDVALNITNRGKENQNDSE